MARVHEVERFVTRGHRTARRSHRGARADNMTRIGIGVWIALALSACGGGDSPTSPSPAPAPTINPPSVTEVWENTLAIGATRFYSYSVALNGTVNITLASLREGGTDSSAELSIGWGTPTGTGCSVSGPSLVRAGTDPQVSTTLAPGVYCVRVSDPGNLTVPAAFRILIAHP